MAGWPAVQVPHTWNATDGADGGGDYARGPGWYVRRFGLGAACVVGIPTGLLAAAKEVHVRCVIGEVNNSLVTRIAALSGAGLKQAAGQ